METRIGTCGSCGGDVMAWTGAWYGVQAPPQEERGEMRLDHEAVTLVDYARDMAERRDTDWFKLIKTQPWGHIECVTRAPGFAALRRC